MERIKAGAELLSLLSDLHIYEQVMSRWFEIADGMMIIRPVYDIWMREIWNEFGPLLKSFKSVKDLYGFSELVWRNTLDSMPLDAYTTGRKWALLGTGRNLRWETVGLIFSGVGVLGSSLGDRDAIFTVTGVKDRSIFARTMRDAVESCIGFCRESECTNEGFACLLYESAVLLESLRGDTCKCCVIGFLFRGILDLPLPDYGAWTRLGETCDLLVLMGLHQEKKVNASTSFFICQLRIRMFEEVYGHDKAMATFLGRPPRLSHRYCVLQLPLDLTDNEMLLEGPELEDALSRLEDGWNTSNQFHRVTWRRVWAQHARIREDILEIALGNSDSMITERGKYVYCIILSFHVCFLPFLLLHPLSTTFNLQLTSISSSAIRDQLAHLKTTMPAFMRTDPSEILAAIQPSGQMLPRRSSSFSPAPAPAPANSTHDILCLLCMHHGIRHTDFLLNRALVNRGHAPPTSLIAPARSLLSLLLQTMAKRDYFRDFQIDLVCLLAFHGLPSAGVLAIELLKQEQRGVYLTSDILPRSETIQDLSVFISALAAVGPGEGNHAICNQGRRALKRLLDKILSPDPVVARPPPPPLAAANTAHNGVDATDVGSDGVGGASSLTDEEQVQLLHSAAGVAGVLHGVTHHTGTHHQSHHHQQQQQQQDQGWQGLYFPTGNDAEFLQWLEDVEWDRGSWLNPV